MQHSFAMFRCLDLVRYELNQFFDFECVLHTRACFKGAIPLESVLLTLQDHIVHRMQQADLNLRIAALGVVKKFGDQHTRFLHLGHRLAWKHTFWSPPTVVLFGNHAIIGAILDALPRLADGHRHSDLLVEFIASAMDALGAITDRGNRSVIRAIAKRTRHADLWVRDRAVHALKSVAKVGDGLAMRAVLRCIDDDEDTTDEEQRYQIRIGTLEALRSIADATDNAVVIAAVVEKIEDDISETVRLEALATLRQVASKGNPVAISACVQCLAEGSSQIREAAWEVIVPLAQKGDKQVISACLSSLEDENIAVCTAAAKLIGKVERKGRAVTVRRLAASLSSRPRGDAVDTAILHSLTRVARKGSHTVVSAIMKFIVVRVADEVQNGAKCNDWYEIFDALWKLAADDDTAVIAFVASHLGSSSDQVSCHAAFCLYNLLANSRVDTSGAWFNAAKAEFDRAVPFSCYRAEMTHGLLRQIFREQGWLPRCRLRKKSCSAPPTSDIRSC